MPAAPKKKVPMVLVISYRHYRFVTSTHVPKAAASAKSSLRTLNHSNKKLQDLHMALKPDEAEKEFQYEVTAMDTMEEADAYKDALIQSFTDQGLSVLNKR